MKSRNKSKKRKTPRLFIIVCVVVLIILFACSSMFRNVVPKLFDKDTPTPSVPSVPEPIKTVQVIDTESISRPYAVMINNNSAVWKYLSGLNDAYIIYEMLVEGGITREMALYKDKDTPKIASVRSSRHYFLDYVLENDAIYVHWGWSPKAKSDIKTLKIDNINGLSYENLYFFRDNSLKIAYEHRGYTSTELISKASSKLNYRLTTENKSLLDYSVDVINLDEYEDVIDALYVEIPYSSSYKAKFFYDESSGLYYRSQNNTELYDYTSKERIVTKNIIVYNVSYKTIDSYGRLDMNNTGSGTGYYISEGRAIKINWEKEARGTKTKYTYSDGTPLKVNDGTTYIGLEPSNQKVKILDTLP